MQAMRPPSSVPGRALLGAARRLAAAGLLAFSVAASAQSPQPLPGLSTREARDEAVWALRAGLNVAALQCQFSPFLATVPTYNAILRQHSDEFASAFKGMTGYFVRSKGPKVGQRAFDTYATRTNQSWATFDAQYSFCNAAALVGRRALAVPKGGFAEFAMTELPALRETLKGTSYARYLAPQLTYASLPDLKNPCPDRTPDRCR